MFSRSSWIRGHVTPLLFGVSMLAFGCANFGQKASQLSTAYDSKVSGPTTQTAQAVAEVAGTIAATAPGTPLGNSAALVMAISGAVIALDRIVSVSLKTVATIANQNTPPPVTTTATNNSPASQQSAPLQVKGVIS